MATTENIVNRLRTVLAPVEEGTASVDDAARHLLIMLDTPFDKPWSRTATSAINQEPSQNHRAVHAGERP